MARLTLCPRCNERWGAVITGGLCPECFAMGCKRAATHLHADDGPPKRPGECVSCGDWVGRRSKARLCIECSTRAVSNSGLTAKLKAQARELYGKGV